MVGPNTVRALIEAIENLDQAHQLIFEHFRIRDLDSVGSSHLDMARTLIAEAAGLLRSILDKGE